MQSKLGLDAGRCYLCDLSLIDLRTITRHCMVRPSIKTGITDLWQVSGRSDVSYPERVQMDVWYVHNWDPWLDIVLPFKNNRNCS